MKLKAYSNLKKICFFIVVSCISLSVLTAESHRPGCKYNNSRPVLFTQGRLFKGKTLSPLISVTPPDTLRFMWDNGKAKTIPSKSSTNPTYNQVDKTSLNLMYPVGGGIPPAFTLPDTNGVNHSLADFAGKVIWLNFWSSTSSTCIAELPRLAAIQNEYGTSKLRILSINIGGTQDTLKQYARDNSALFLEDSSGSVFSKYNISGTIPVNYIIRRGGKVFHGITGFMETIIKCWLDSCLIDSVKACDTVKIMTVINNGDTDLTVTNITKSNSWIVSVSPTSFTLAPDSSKNVTVTVTRNGLDGGAHFGSLSIYSNDTVRSPYVEPVKFIINDVGTEETENILPADFALSRNYPNPITSGTYIEYTLSGDAVTSFEVYDMTGRSICNLITNNQKAGSYSVYWDGKDNTGRKVVNGIYFVRMTAGDFKATKKLTVLR
ncbi:MAG: redoxin domain-containing protein [bacterium]|nr:redoxin domain-containing protein [bacterium]